MLFQGFEIGLDSHYVFVRVVCYGARGSSSRQSRWSGLRSLGAEALLVQTEESAEALPSPATHAPILRLLEADR